MFLVTDARPRRCSDTWSGLLATCHDASLTLNSRVKLMEPVLKKDLPDRLTVVQVKLDILSDNKEVMGHQSRFLKGTGGTIWWCQGEEMGNEKVNTISKIFTHLQRPSIKFSKFGKSGWAIIFP